MESKKCIYTVQKATPEQLCFLSENKWPPVWREKCYAFQCFVALDENYSILGYLLAEPKEISAPLKGIDWWIKHLIVFDPAHRRCGIGSALLKEAILHAKKEEVRHFCGNTKPTPAQLFWHHHGFSLAVYGKRIEDPGHPDTHGNFQHILISRLDDSSPEISCKDYKRILISSLPQERVEAILKEVLPGKKNPDYWTSKKDLLFGLCSKDETGRELGYLLSYEDEIGTPIEGRQWMIAHLYVDPEFRHRGIGSALLSRLAELAASQGISQLMGSGIPREMNLFWYKNNFDIFDWHYLSEKNEFLCTVKVVSLH